MGEPQLTELVPLLMPWAASVVLAMGRAAGLVLGLPHTSGHGIPKSVQAIVVVALAIGMVGARPVVTVTLSADHRAGDGHTGGLFLAEIERLLQKPEEL